MNAVGNVIISHFDSTAVLVDIGSPGATSWDFSGLNSHISGIFTSVVPSSTPYFSTDFPTSNVVFKFKEVLDADTADGWQYSTQNPGEYLGDGLALESSVEGEDFLMIVGFSPAQIIFPLPFSYNSQWSSDYTLTSTSYYNGFPLFSFTEDHTETVVVDAWGPMKMPGGAVLQALRLRREDVSPSPTPPSTIRSVSYSFITKSGTSVEISAMDTTAANSGVIETDGVSWSSSNTNVGIENDNEPVTYSLQQNAPNPASSFSSIWYSLGERQPVQIKLYNHLGIEIATLVNEVKTAGIHEVKLDATRLTPGNYYYKMQAGNFIDTKKMIVIR